MDGLIQLIKRLLDLCVVLPLLVMLTPLMALLAGLVRWNLGVPVLFRQLRPGIGARPFVMYKFRTMTDARDTESVW